MPDQFRDLEDAFARLKRQASEGKLSRREFVDTLRQLRIKDDEGRFWMIGARTGKWYCFENGAWREAKPPSQRERRAICVACGFENDLESEVCARCGSPSGATAPASSCPECGAAIECGATACARCGFELGESGPSSGPSSPGVAAKGFSDASVQAVVRAVDPVSFLWFFAATGFFAGILAGLLVGVVGVFPGFVARLPAFLAEVQGQLWGGLIFSVLGAAAGFAAGAAGGWLAALASNAILSLVGGVRVRWARRVGSGSGSFPP